MTAKLVSCIIPVFNGERFLAETVDNILTQTYRPIEVIVVDDGSTDGTASAAAGFGQSIRYFAQPNQGHAAARNLGFESARGDLIAFQDADDLWHPEKLERQVGLLQRHPQAGGCVTHARNFWTGEPPAELATRQGRRRAEGVPGFTFPCTLLHRWALERVGVLDPNLGHTDDADWFLRARAAGVEIKVLDEVLSFRRLHDANRSRANAGQSLDEYLHLLKRHLDRQRTGNG